MTCSKSPLSLGTSVVLFGAAFFIFPSFQELKIIHKLNFLGSYCFSKTCCEFPFFCGISSSRNTFKCITYGWDCLCRFVNLELCFGLSPACCATTVELSCLACHLIDGAGVFNVLQPQPAKTKLHKNDTREKSPWVSHKTLAQNSTMSQNTWLYYTNMWNLAKEII